MCSCEVIPIHYDDFVLLVGRCAVIQHDAEHVVKKKKFFCVFLFDFLGVSLHLINISMASALP